MNRSVCFCSWSITDNLGLLYVGSYILMSNWFNNKKNKKFNWLIFSLTFDNLSGRKNPNKLMRHYLYLAQNCGFFDRNVVSITMKKVYAV